MSLGIERTLVGILDKVRSRSNTTFKRFHPVMPELGIYMDYNQVVRFGSPSMRRLEGMKNIAIDDAFGGADPARRILGHAQKLSGSLEHMLLKTTRTIAHGGIHVSRIAEVDLLTGYGSTARIELPYGQLFQLAQAQRHLPGIPLISAALQAIGSSMAKVDLAPLPGETGKLAADRNGKIIKTGVTDATLAGIGGLLLGGAED